MHFTEAFLDEYPLPDSFELKSFMLTLVCLLNHHMVFGLKTLSKETLLGTLFNFLIKLFYAHMCLLPFIRCKVGGVKITMKESMLHSARLVIMR